MKKAAAMSASHDFFLLEARGGKEAMLPALEPK
jgi:hypothetical protein